MHLLIKCAIKLSLFTGEIALCSQIADGQSKYREFVEFDDDTLFKRQKTGEQFEFAVESLAMAFARIALGRFFRRRFQSTS